MDTSEPSSLQRAEETLLKRLLPSTPPRQELHDRASFFERNSGIFFSALLQPEVFDASRPSNDGPRDPAAGKDGTIKEFAPSALGPRILLRRQKSAPTIPSFRHRECVGHWSKFRPSSIDARLQIWPLFYLNLLPAARRQHVLAHRATVTL